MSKATNTLLPILEELYAMPALKIQDGVADLERKLLRPMEATIQDLLQHEDLLQTWIQKMQAQGDALGRPRLRPGEVVVTGTYKMKDVKSRVGLLSPKALSPHHKLSPMRAIAVKGMISGLLNRGLIPCAVKAGNTPSGSRFDNFNQVLYTAWVLYVDYEGLTRFHELARQTLTFLFHGTFTTKSGCAAPIIRYIHQAMQLVAYRFTHNIDTHFKGIMTYLNDHKSYTKFLDDGGRTKVPKRYLALWEKGFRNAAISK